jgi:DNA-directed RNA polymerase subunit RPC12/RpoP
MMGSYEGMRRVVYGKGTEYDGATFVPVCSECGRFVGADETMRFVHETIAPGPNATCKRCGRVEMLFEGFV